MKNRLVAFALSLLSAFPVMAQQDAFDRFKKQQTDKFEQFKADQQAEFDAFRKRVNAEYANFLRKTWEEFPIHKPIVPVKEKEIPPVVYQEPEPEPAPVPQPKPTPQPTPQPKEDIKPLPSPKPQLDTKPVQITVKPTVVVVPQPTPAPEPIAPVQPKEEPYKKVSVAYFGTLFTFGFPVNDNLKIKTLNEKAIADAWDKLSNSAYDITVKTALDARKANSLCDWAYLKLLQAATEKQYGKTNEAVLAQAFLMVQSGYRIRLGLNSTKLYLLVASQYEIFNMSYYERDNTRYYIVSDDQNAKMHITDARYGKEKSLSLQISKLPSFGNEPTPKRTLTSKKGVATNASVNKNLIDFFNSYPQACISGHECSRWAAYANTPLDKAVKDMLYPPLKKTITGMKEQDAVGILLNWVQTAFEYGYDDKVWGGDRAFFAQETLYYPYSDCEDRAILFSRMIRDLMGLDVVLLYYPGHLATAVAFNDEVNGDFLTYKNRKYIVCDPTYINAGVGKTMPGMNNSQAEIIALK